MIKLKAPWVVLPDGRQEQICDSTVTKPKRSNLESFETKSMLELNFQKTVYATPIMNLMAYSFYGSLKFYAIR